MINRDVEETHWSVGNLAAIMSLDAVQILHDTLGVSRFAPPQTVTGYLQTLLKSSDLPEFTIDLYQRVVDRHRTTGDDHERDVLAWLLDAHGGSLQSNPQLALWIMYYRKLKNMFRNGEHDFGSQHAADAQAFVNEIDDQINRDGFADQLDEIRSKSTFSDWDRRLHQQYDWVYFDTNSGSDPLMKLMFVNDGQGFRRALQLFDFEERPDFPFEVMQAQGQQMADEYGLWMPEGMAFPPLSDVR